MSIDINLHVVDKLVDIYKKSDSDIFLISLQNTKDFLVSLPTVDAIYKTTDNDYFQIFCHKINPDFKLLNATNLPVWEHNTSIFWRNIKKYFDNYLQLRYVVLYGGRGSAKSVSIADLLILEAAFNKQLILCCREYQSSISDSVYRILVSRIYALKLNKYFIILKKEIRATCGSEFIFKGLRQDAQELKSMQGVKKCWVEEAERVSIESWQFLIPTIREECSQFFISFNPADEKNSTYQRFIVNTARNVLKIKINYYDNPFFPDVLREELEYDKQYNPDKFKHIWEGECTVMSNAIVFKDKFIVEYFDLENYHGIDFFNGKRLNFKYGMDFGFSTDPIAVCECFVDDGNLYITNEVYSYKTETDDIIPLCKKQMTRILKGKVFADSSRPETISQLSKVRTHKDGYLLESLTIKPAIKGKNSVIEGIEFLRNFKKIIIHPSCKNAIYEFNNYSYKQDDKTGKILNELKDQDNHFIDALRYSFNDEIQALKRTLNISEKTLQNFRV